MRILTGESSFRILIPMQRLHDANFSYYLTWEYQSTLKEQAKRITQKLSKRGSKWIEQNLNGPHWFTEFTNSGRWIENNLSTIQAKC